jgi:catechol 2,3-dioxygenase-like lactoylglutathione lyase family enzyme
MGGMTLHSFTHVALCVERLRQAETLYRDLFALEVAFREAETAEGWATLPPSAGWDDAERAGLDLGLVMLHRDGLRLALEAVGAVGGSVRLSHLGVQVDGDERASVRGRAAAMGCEIVTDTERALVFVDPLGVRWELNTFAYDDPTSLSTGARGGRWLDVTHPAGDAR